MVSKAPEAVVHGERGQPVPLSGTANRLLAVGSVVTAPAPIRADIDAHLLSPPGAAGRHRRLSLRAAILATDVVVIVAALVLAHLLHAALAGPNQSPESSDTVVLGALSLPAWVVVLFRYRLYSANHVASRGEEWGRLVHAVGASVVAMAALAFMAGLHVRRGWLVLTLVLGTALLALEREAVRGVLRWFRRTRRLVRRVVIVGGNSDAMALRATLVAHQALGYEVVGLVDDCLASDDRLASDDLLERRAAASASDKVREVVDASGANGVILVGSALDTQTSNRLVRELTEAGIRIELLPSLMGVATGRISLGTLGQFPVVRLSPVCRGGWHAAAKRSVDLAVAGLGLILAAPLMAPIAVAVKLNSRGPVFFRQKRVGQSGELFEMLKFRTMVVDAEQRLSSLRELNEADGPLFKIHRDPRVTRVGTLLRRLSLDELPQFWNVLKGDMAVVGPRPALPEEITGWSPELHERLKVRPGITGLWQVSGRCQTSFDDYGHLDLYYVDNWSFVADLSIMARTIPAVLSRRGAC